MAVKLSKSRKVDREGIAAAQSLFEGADCIFLEVPQQHDIGKDAYVDIGQAGTVTHLCAALQIKSGLSFRQKDGTYRIPIRQHAEIWQRSTIPVFGVVYDPEDRLFRWTDLTRHLRENPQKNSGSVKIEKDFILDGRAIQVDLINAISAYAQESRGSIALDLLGSDLMQQAAVFDAWALGRNDVRYLILLRRLILQMRPDALRDAIHGLSYTCGHPDILFNSDNRFPEHISLATRCSFRWSAREIAHMLHVVSPEEYGRGTLGQLLDMILRADPDIGPELENAIGILVDNEELDCAVSGSILALSYSNEARECLSRLIHRFPEISRNKVFLEVAQIVREDNFISLY